MKKTKSSFVMEKLFLWISICVLYFATKTTGQDIQNKNIHCDKWDSIAEEHIEYSLHNDYDYYYRRHTTTRKTYTYTYECTVRNYEIASDRDYHIDKSDKIYKLTIEDSSMNGLPVKLFKHLTNLQTLIVKKTSLQHVDEIKLPKVTQIDLSENEIVSLHENTFAECSELSEINLSNNNISILQGPFFDSNQEIKILDLSYNKITNITEYTFNDFHVESLKLSHNHLEVLDLNRFSELSYLNSLDLSYNKLKSIEAFEDFEGGNFTAESVQLQFNNLTSLNLKYCDIKQIYASNNKLKSVEIGGNCVTLDLQKNEITDLT
uniref:Uncharacterized protein n=1 Tax=Lutzomyia longipalpis TaxID=7200 RepID=A0A1B0F068_LUTLO